MKTAIAISLVVLVLGPVSCTDAVYVASFDGDDPAWTPSEPGSARLTEQAASVNSVLELLPLKKQLSYVLFDGAGERRSFRMTGRFLFPTNGDGYLGLIYDWRRPGNRTDYGCVYIKSNGSYIRFSPHFDGNPSWRLYEELRVNLTGDRAIETGRWYDFRFDVGESSVSLYIDDLSSPVFSTDIRPVVGGLVGAEARPGGGEAVWIDDIRITAAPDSRAPIARDNYRVAPASRLSDWQVFDVGLSSEAAMRPQDAIAPGTWSMVAPDARGAIITGEHTNYRAGDRHYFVFRALLANGDNEENAVLAFSSANRLSVWLNGENVGIVEPRDYIWQDHFVRKDHRNSRLRISPLPGQNELLVVIDADRFAAGGFFVEVAGNDTPSGL